MKADRTLPKKLTPFEFFYRLGRRAFRREARILILLLRDGEYFIPLRRPNWILDSSKAHLATRGY